VRFNSVTSSAVNLKLVPTSISHVTNSANFAPML
jgi:hypothetical protein